jgi:cell division protein FtsN
VKHTQRGGFVLGLIVGLLAGLALALGVALYITKAPVPFVNKVPLRTADQDSAEIERNRNWDPNAPLADKPATKPVAPSTAATPPAELPPGIAAVPATPSASAATAPPGRDPAAILSGAAPAADPYVFFVQAGAYTRAEEAEAQRAKLAILGLEAKVSEREQAGRTVYRVRAGPFETREQAEAVQARLTESSIDARLVRATRS